MTVGGMGFIPERLLMMMMIVSLSVVIDITVLSLLAWIDDYHIFFIELSYRNNILLRVGCSGYMRNVKNGTATIVSHKLHFPISVPFDLAVAGRAQRGKQVTSSSTSTSNNNCSITYIYSDICCQILTSGLLFF